MSLITILKPQELSASQWQLWAEWQQANPALDSPYFRPEFTRAVAGVRADVEVAVIEQSGATVGLFPFQRGALSFGQPVGGRLSDYHAVICPPGISIDPIKLLHGCKLAGWDFDHLLLHQAEFAPFVKTTWKSPYLDLAAGYEAYCKQRKLAGSDTIPKTNQKSRKLEREVGPLTFDWHDPTTHAMETLIRWKSEHLRRSGLTDVLDYPWTVRLLDQLLQPSAPDFGGVLSVLRLGERPVALTYSLRSRKTLHGWFTVYDPDLGQYSPGLILFLRIAEQAAQLGITKFDLGAGDERYKWSLASGATELAGGTLGNGSLKLWLRGKLVGLRDWVKQSPLNGAARAPGRLVRQAREWLTMR